MTKQPADYQEDLDHMSGEAALDQSIALNRIVMTLLEQSKKQTRLTAILLLISVMVNLLIVGAFLWYESGFDTAVTTTTTTITQDAGEGDGNNVYQAGNSARYIQGNMIEEATDGTTDNNNYNHNTDKNP